MLEIKSVTKRYGIDSFPAVLDLNLKVNKGEIFGFIGPNGAGKTTTIKMITGILQPTEGEIFINGINLRENPLACKQQFGYVPDNPDIYERLTGIDYLNFIADVYKVPLIQRRELIEEFTKKFGIYAQLKQQIKSYSHGMRQKLIICASLIHQPALWILDEPMVGLDPIAAKLLKDEMKNHCKKGNTVFFSTHVLEVAEKLCDRVGIIKASELAAVGPPDEIKRNLGKEASLEDAFVEIINKEA